MKTVHFAIALSCWALTACSETTASAPHNVLFICLDTVRADRLGCYGYAERETTPALDALAARSTLFVDASAAAGWTKPSVPSFLTGTYPLQHGVYEGSSKDATGQTTDLLPAEATTLAERFQAAGYTTGAFVHNAQLRRGTGMEQGFELYEDQAGDARDIRERAERWLGERQKQQPFFLYLHFLDAHWPYPIPDEYATRFRPAADVAPFRDEASRALLKAVNAGERSLSASELAALNALYDGALRYLDDELGQLFASLAEQGLSDDTVICVLADHGEEFLEHGKIGHGHGLWENLLRVPWILFVPERAGQRVTTPVALIDVFATVTAAAGLSSGNTHAGTDRLAHPNRERSIFAEHKAGKRYQQSWRDGSAKIVRQLSFATPADWSFDPAQALTLGSRWEVKLGPVQDGAWRAVEFQPSEDDASDPIEWKGPVTAFDPEAKKALEVGGVRFELARDCEFYGECRGDEDPRDLCQPGRLVKVKATFDDGDFVAEKVKIYAAEDEASLELRGTVAALEQVGAERIVEISGFSIRCDANVDWDLEDTDLGEWAPVHSDLCAAVRGFVEGREPAGLSPAITRFDLGSDPGELHPAMDADPVLLQALDRAGAALAESALAGAGSRSILSAERLEELRALGYVE